jgi:integrase
MTSSITKQAIDAMAARAHRAGDVQLELVDDRVPGLRVRAGKRAVTWSLLVRLRNGKRSRVTLGTWPMMSIAEAREAARLHREQVSDGVDPNEVKQAEIETVRREYENRITVKLALDQYEAIKLSQLRHGPERRRSLDGKRGIISDLVDRELASLTRAELTSRIRDLAVKSPLAGNRKLAHLKAFLNWCVNEDFITTNVIDKVKKPGREVPRTRCHSVEELREIWAAAGRLGYPFGPLIQLLIVIPMRREEIASLPIDELKIDWQSNSGEGKWTIPGERVKNDRALNVPLSPLATRIIRQVLDDPERPKDSRFLFTTTGATSVSGFRKAKDRLDRYIQEAREKAALEAGQTPVEMPHWRIHDLRTSFATQAAEVLHIDIAVVDRMLNHVATATTSKVARIYNMSELFEQRREASNAWAALLEREVIGRTEPFGVGL